VLYYEADLLENILTKINSSGIIQNFLILTQMAHKVKNKR